MWLPPNYDISKNKYPLLVHVHGAPGAVQINERFQVGWHTYLVANRSIVYVRIEGRGSQLVGQRARSSGHRRLGSLEVEDQILVVKELIQKYNYIDGAKVGIWGSSYGGYSALLALALDEDHVIKCGMAVSPIVSWRHYNALYTERYMHFPTEDDNLVGYEEADVSNKADRLNSKMVLLLHGTVDTKVHFHHSLKMARALRGNGVAFRFQIYPGEGHGLRGVRPHVFRAMEDFLEHCFPLD
ncbi:venom dipeptidyl peptidase 4 [Anabrus simplex]|uniref:venom dipeptidyl peptidase 4 n=1 Tax=Anabrus simplex TaxID=316456 RepID=UPI0035A37CBE